MAWVSSFVVGALLAWAILAFNRLVRLRNQVKAGWSDIDVQLMRRHDPESGLMVFSPEL